MSESCEDDENQLKSVHALTTNDISEVTETKLTDDSSPGCGNLDSSIRVGRDRSLGFAVLPENNTHHSSDQIDGENLFPLSDKWLGM